MEVLKRTVLNLILFLQHNAFKVYFVMNGFNFFGDRSFEYLWLITNFAHNVAILLEEVVIKKLFLDVAYLSLSLILYFINPHGLANNI